MNTNPDHLGLLVGRDGRTIRAWLRATFPRPLAQKHTPWTITWDMVIAAARRFR